MISKKIVMLSALLAATPAAPEIAFEEITDTAGVDYSGGSFGIAWGDANGDGWPDLWLTNHADPDHLYLNNENGSFARAFATNMPVVNVDTHGVAFVDIDGDDDDDVILQTGGAGVNDGRDFLFINYGNPYNMTDEATLRGADLPGHRGRTPHFVDVDSDSDLDLILNGYLGPAGGPLILLQESDGSFGDGTALTGFEPTTSEFSTLIRLENDDPFILAQAASYPAAAFNIAALPFTDEVDQWFSGGLASTKDAAAADVDGDLDADLILARGSEKSEVWQPTDAELNLWLKESGTVGVRFATAGMITVDVSPKTASGAQGPWKLDEIFIGSTGANPDQLPVQLDGSLPQNQGLYALTPGNDGILIGYDDVGEAWEIRKQGGGGIPEIEVDSTAPIGGVTLDGFGPFVPDHQQILLDNQGTSFADVSAAAGMPDVKNCFSVVAADFDNDMDVDIYFACSLPRGFAPNILLENQGNAVFTEVTGAGGAEGSTIGRSDVVASVDLDNDGFLDLTVTQGRGSTWGAFNQGPTQLFRNLGNGNHWLNVDLKGVDSNREGVGALLFLKTPDGKVQRREMDGGMHRASQNDRRVHFGLGANATYTEIEIRWPSGTVQRVGPGNANQFLTITEPADTDADSIPDAADNCSAVANPSQCDTNNDQYGNRCDADLDNNGIVNSFDLHIMRGQLGASGENDADLDCNGTVNSFDVQIIRELFGGAPGPSGTAGP